MIVYNSPQGSDEWKREKAGHFSGSKANDLLMKSSMAGHQNLIYQIAYERMTGEPIETYQSQAMKDGVENEPIARESYELETYNKVHEVGFIEINSWIGVSLDGIIGEDGAIEIKCPQWNTQMSYLESQEIPKNYYNQMQFQLYVSGRKWVDFYSWHPKLPSFLKRVERDEEKIKEIQEAIFKAIKEVEVIINKLKG